MALLLVQCLFLILALKYLLYLEEIMQLRVGYGSFLSVIVQNSNSS